MSDPQTEQPKLTVAELVTKARATGIGYGRIRRAMAQQGIELAYRPDPPGSKASARRRKQYNLCESGCGNQRQKGSDLCEYCLAARWAE